MALVKKTSTAFSSFIDSKYLPMELKTKIIAAIVILLIPLLIFFFVFFRPNQENISKLETQKKALTTELQNVKAKARNLVQMEKDLKETQEAFDEKAALLPKDKEIPKLLKDISALGTGAGLEFLSFKPLADVPKDFYAEIPIAIAVKGAYHSMGHFFDTVSKLDRIVSVKDIKIITPVREKSEMLLSADCQLVTYRFTNVELPKPQEMKK